MDNEKKMIVQSNADEKKGLSIHHFLIKGLQDLYWIEKYLASSITEIIKAISSGDLKKTIEDYLVLTPVHITRLEKTFEVLKEDPKSVKSEAITDILKQVVDIISKTKDDSDIRDAALVMIVHKIKRYEIAAYNNPIEASKLMGLQDITLLLKTNLEEEKIVVQKLSIHIERYLDQIMNSCSRTDPK